MNYSVFSRPYFTDWILTATTLVSLIVSLVHRVHKQLFLIQIYIVASLFIDVLSTITELFFSDNELWLDTDCIVFNLFSILEISIVYLFTAKLINKKETKLVAQILCIVYIFSCVLIWISFPKAIISNTPDLFGLEGILISSICLLYFLDLMHSLPMEGIMKKPDFWVISGILFYFSTTSPLYFVLTGLKNIPFINIAFTSANYCLYTVLFLTFIKAYLCPIHIQK